MLDEQTIAPEIYALADPVPGLTDEEQARVGRFIAINTPRPNPAPSLRVLYNPIHGYWYVADRDTHQVVGAGYRNQYLAKQAHNLPVECNLVGGPTEAELASES